MLSFNPLSMRSKAVFRKPLQDDIPFPPMPPPAQQASAFIDRVYDIAQRWVQEEWNCIEAIKRAAAAKPETPKAHISQAIKEAKLTPSSLAQKLDNISMSAFKRELSRFNAPAPGQLIREMRIAFAKHLLTHTRLKIHHIAARAGYANPDIFAAVFRREAECQPREFRHNAAPRPTKKKSTRGKRDAKPKNPRRQAQKP